jgi:hypothetical protein
MNDLYVTHQEQDGSSGSQTAALEAHWWYLDEWRRPAQPRRLLSCLFDHELATASVVGGGGKRGVVLRVL